MVWLNNLGFADPYGTSSRAVDALFKRRMRDLGNGLCVVRVGDGDRLLSAVIDCLTRGECGTTSTAPDPLLDWVYRPRNASEVYKPLIAPPSPDRLAWFRWLVSYSAYFAIARNGLYALVDATDPRQVLAAAITGPPGTIPYGRMSGGEMGDWCQKAGMQMAIEVLANNKRNRVLGTWQGQAHGSGGHRHLEVIIFATAPECQGQGAGTALLRFLGEVADADGVPTHLETAGSRNICFYAKKGGFQEVHCSPVASFNHEGGGVAMQRPSGAHADGLTLPKLAGVQKVKIHSGEKSAAAQADDLESPKPSARQKEIVQSSRKSPVVQADNLAPPKPTGGRAAIAQSSGKKSAVQADGRSGVGSHHSVLATRPW